MKVNFICIEGLFNLGLDLVHVDCSGVIYHVEFQKLNAHTWIDFLECLSVCAFIFCVNFLYIEGLISQWPTYVMFPMKDPPPPTHMENIFELCIA